MYTLEHLKAGGIRFTQVSGRQPILLSDPQELFYVESGAVDVFLVGWKNGEPVGGRDSLLRITGPGILLGVDVRSVTEEWMLIGVITPDSQVARMSRDSLLVRDRAAVPLTESIALVETWLLSLGYAVRRSAPPKASIEIAPGETRALAAGQSLAANREVVWLRPEIKASWFLGREDYGAIRSGLPFPLAKSVWLVCKEDTSVEAMDTAACLDAGSLWPGLDGFARLALQAAIVNRAEDAAEERQRVVARERIDDDVMEDAVQGLAAILSKGARRARAGAGADPLLAACHLIGDAMGMEFRAPPESAAARSTRDPVGSIAKASRVNHRRILLRGDWWRSDNGPLLAYTQETPRPVALIPLTASRYALHDPTLRTVRPVTAEVAAELQPFAYSFYKPFARTVVGLKDVMRLGSIGSIADFAMIILMGLAGGLLGMVTPIATGMLFDTVIPGADKNQLVQLTFGLIAIAFASSSFQLTRGIAVLRVEGKMDSLVQAGIWDRLLTLPAPFFRNFTAGDLATRANGINSIRQVLSGTTISTILSSVFSLFSFALLFYYNLRLAFVATALVFVVLIVTMVASLLKLRYERRLAHVHGRISGMVLQFLRGIAKLKVTGSERRAFSAWAKEFSHQRSLAFTAQNIGNVLGTFNAIFPILGSMAIFITVVFFSKGAHLTTGQFLAFNAAFGSFLGAMLGMTGSVISILRIVPLYERAKPILQTLPEVNDAKEDPGELIGEIEVNHVYFSYNEDSPPVIDDVSMHIRPGQLVALVGASGSGKSTMLRLLLGFEQPSSGTIYYDGKDLAGVDLVGVRRQLGVVLQNGQLLQGDIFSNIAGASAATLDDAWEAARLAGLDKDIEALPMGMHTIIAEGGGGLSGGQRQRLMIARAIVHKPRILFFDEATSALDNATQSVVSKSLDRLEATRVVIAHRLSTIVNADYIYVMDKGRVVQQGAYRELIDQPGLFAELAKRQIA